MMLWKSLENWLSPVKYSGAVVLAGLLAAVLVDPKLLLVVPILPDYRQDRMVS
jgi:hypothetical protein